jgi:hypothetical protein
MEYLLLIRNVEIKINRERDVWNLGRRGYMFASRGIKLFKILSRKNLFNKRYKIMCKIV